MALLRALLLVCALVALPTFASVASAAPVASIAQAAEDDSGADVTDADVPDDPATDPATDDSSCDFTDTTDQRSADGGDSTDVPDDSADDPSADDQGADDQSTDDPADSQDVPDDQSSADDLCTTLEDDLTPEPEDDAPDGDHLRTKGLSATLTMPGPGTIDGSLTQAGSTGARIAAVRVLGTGHRRVAQAGTVTLRVKLTRQGKRLVRSSRRALRLALQTHIVLASGKTLDTSAPVTVKPAKKKPAHRKPAHRPKRQRS